MNKSEARRELAAVEVPNPNLDKGSTFDELSDQSGVSRGNIHKVETMAPIHIREKAQRGGGVVLADTPPILHLTFIYGYYESTRISLQ